MIVQSNSAFMIAFFEIFTICCIFDNNKLFTLLQHVVITTQHVDNNKLFKSIQHVVIPAQHVVIHMTTCCHNLTICCSSVLKLLNYLIQHELTKDGPSPIKRNRRTYLPLLGCCCSFFRKFREHILTVFITAN